MNLSTALEGVINENAAMVDTIAVDGNVSMTASYRTRLKDMVTAQQSIRVHQQSGQSEAAVQELAETHHDVEKVQALVKELTKNSPDGTVTLEAYVLAQQAIKSTGLGEYADVTMGPALESLRPGTESITVSAEALKDFISGVIKAGADLAKRFADEVHRSLGFLNTRILVARKFAQNNASRAKKLRHVDNAGLVIPYSVSSLGLNAAVPANIANYLQESVAIIDKYTQAIRVLVKGSGNPALLDKLQFNSPEAFDASFKAAASGWKDPRDVLSDKELSFVHPGDRLLFTPGERKYTGGDSAMIRFDKLANTYRPTTLRANPGNFKSLSKKESAAPVLTADEVTALMAAYDKALSRLSAVALLIDSMVAGWKTNPIGVSWKAITLFGNGLQYLYSRIMAATNPSSKDYQTQMALLQKVINVENSIVKHGYYDAAFMMTSIAGGVNRYARDSLKALESQSNPKV